MRNGLVACVSVAFTVGVVFVSMVACSDPAPDSTFNTNGTDGGPVDAGNGFNTDANVPPDSAAATTCSPSLPATFAPVWNPPTRAVKCSADDLGGYYDACTADLKAPGCTTWLAAHADCGACIQPDNNTGPIQTFRSKLYLLLNVAGCISIVEKGVDGGTDACATAYDAAFQCRRDSCDNCFAGAVTSSQAAFAAFNGCERAAECSTYDTTQNSACGTNLKTAGAPTCFPTETESSAMDGADPTAAAAAQKTFYVRVMGITCGPES